MIGGLLNPDPDRVRRSRTGLCPFRERASVLGVVCFSALWVLLTAGIPPEAEELPKPVRFAYDLMGQGHWEQAIEEFRRFCYLHPQDPLVPKASLAIGRCYEEAGRFGEAVEAYRLVASRYAEDAAGREALYRVGEACYRGERFEEARIAMERFLLKRPEDPWRWKARYRGAWASLQLHAFVVAGEAFSSLASEENPYRQPAQRMSEGIKGIEGLPYRSPSLAGGMSALLPGSGQAYTGQWKNGWLALLVNGGLIFASVEAWDKEVYGVAGLVSVLALTFYAGNVYGAVNSAYRANQERLEAHLRHYANAYEWW